MKCIIVTHWSIIVDKSIIKRNMEILANRIFEIEKERKECPEYDQRFEGFCIGSRNAYKYAMNLFREMLKDE